MDETYRRFHSGRFGPSTVTPEFSTELEDSGGVTNQGSPADTKKPKLGKDKAGNTYKNQDIADDFDAQEALMKS